MHGYVIEQMHTTITRSLQASQLARAVTARRDCRDIDITRS